MTRAIAITSMATMMLAGCITHLPVRTTDHLRIAWARDFSDASQRAQREGKPILMLLVAGQIDGLC
jgi:hypothetical protein